MNIQQIRVLKEAAVDLFSERIALVRSTGEPSYIHEIDPFSEEFTELISDVSIDADQTFENRFELAKYLTPIIDEAFISKETKRKYINNPDFWSWFSLVYINQLTGNFTKRKRISRQEHYIPAIGRYRMKWSSMPIAYRHSVREPYRLYSLYGESSKIYFAKKVSDAGNIIESMRSRKSTSSHKGIHEYLIRKYAKEDGFARPRTADPVRPSARQGKSSTVRLAKIYKRLNISYVGPLLDADEIASNVGPGFELLN